MGVSCVFLFDFIPESVKSSIERNFVSLVFILESTRISALFAAYFSYDQCM